MSLPRALVFAALLGLVGCSKADPPAPRPASSETAVQVAIGGAREPGGTLAFDIVAVHEHVDRADAAPWWKGSGAWTFFDATTAGGAALTVGVRETKSPSAPGEFVITDAVVSAKDAVEGEKLVVDLARALRVEVPAVTAPRRGVMPLEAASVVLADDAKRDGRGAFVGSGGGWTASKWTFEVPGDTSAELFVNYNLGAKKGEFRRKSSYYDPEVVKFLAASLRDGAPLSSTKAR
jgi:hypothetical protein